ncbi:MAG TPA: DUF6398 domain-containing protein [Methanospirillum sp.]|nr:DUF6398 domain-containing protein [Methanospirillum sp.]
MTSTLRSAEPFRLNLARKKGSPILRGKSEVWAPGIRYAVGQMNFLFDQSFKPYQSAELFLNYH